MRVSYFGFARPDSCEVAIREASKFALHGYRVVAKFLDRRLLPTDQFASPRNNPYSWPDSLSLPQVEMSADVIRLAAKSRWNNSGGVISAGVPWMFPLRHPGNGPERK